MPFLNYFTKPANAPEIVARETIQAQSGKIRLSDTDQEAGLDLFCYHKCDNDETSMVKNCRGIIFSGDKVVMRGFPYTEEYTPDSLNSLKTVLEDRLSKCKFFDAHEGALLRVFYWQAKWYITTHRKLDAFRSKWASKESFGQMFKGALEAKWSKKDPDFMKQCYGADWETSTDASGETAPGAVQDRFMESLDKTKQYMFLILNNYDNRIVCVSPEVPTVYHVGTFDTTLDGDVRVPALTCTMTDRCGLPWPEEHTFATWEEVVTEVDDQNSECLQGLIIYDTESTKQYKLFNKEYHELFKVRGNEPSVKFRYLQVRMDKELVDRLYYLYPKFADAFDDYENTLYECAKDINKNYIDRFIKKKYVTVPKEEFHVMKACHDWHLQDREKNRISLRKVIDMMNDQAPSNLNRIIRRFKSEQVKDELSKHTKTTRLRARSISQNQEDAPHAEPVE